MTAREDGLLALANELEMAWNTAEEFDIDEFASKIRALAAPGAGAAGQGEYGSIAHRLYCEIACNGDPACFNGLDESVRQRWIDGVEIVLGTPPAASMDAELRGAGVLLRAAMHMQEQREAGELHLSQPAAKHYWDNAKRRWDELIDSAGGAKGELSMDERMARLAVFDPGAYLHVRGPIDQGGESVWEKQSSLYEQMQDAAKANGFNSLTHVIASLKQAPQPDGGDGAVHGPIGDDVRAALLFALWHHQGGSSGVGQPIRKMLGMHQHQHLSPEQSEIARAVQSSIASRPSAAAVVWPPRAMKGDNGIKLRDGHERLWMTEEEASVWNRCLDECQRALATPRAEKCKGASGNRECQPRPGGTLCQWCGGDIPRAEQGDQEARRDGLDDQDDADLESWMGDRS